MKKPEDLKKAKIGIELYIPMSDYIELLKEYDELKIERDELKTNKNQLIFNID